MRVSTAVLSVLALILPLLSGSPGPGTARPSSGERQAREEPTEIVLLGTSHFAGSSSDLHTFAIDDILSEERQAELDEVAARVAGFSPEQFFVECTLEEQGRVDSLYDAYRRGRYDPTAEGDRGEIRQLGFRAAERADLRRVRCVDARGVLPIPQARRVAAEHNPEVLSALKASAAESSAAVGPGYLERHTIGEWLRALNSDSLLWRNHRDYIVHYARVGTFDGSGLELHLEGDLQGRRFAFIGDPGGYYVDLARRAVVAAGGAVTDSIGAETDFAVVEADAADAVRNEAARAGVRTLEPRQFLGLVAGAGDIYVGFPEHHIGADLVGEWYKRNLRIYANLWRAVEPGTERAVLLIGQGHVWTLRQFLRDNPRFEVVPVEEVL